MFYYLLSFIYHRRLFILVPSEGTSQRTQVSGHGLTRRQAPATMPLSLSPLPQYSYGYRTQMEEICGVEKCKSARTSRADTTKCWVILFSVKKKKGIVLMMYL